MRKLFTPPWFGVLIVILLLILLEISLVITGIRYDFFTFVFYLLILLFFILSVFLRNPIISARTGIYILGLFIVGIASLYIISIWGYVVNTLIPLAGIWTIIGMYFFSLSPVANKESPACKFLLGIHRRIPNPTILNNEPMCVKPQPSYKPQSSPFSQQPKFRLDPSKTLHFNVENAIRRFKPRKKYRYEIDYQNELYHWLSLEFPVQYEKQEGSSRPDLVIKNIAIEIKGPTRNRDLDTLSTKFVKYPLHYPHLIIVLFDCDFSEGHYNEIYTGMRRIDPDIVIIRID
jgi:uncharacterized membrane protein YhaH (DUF805 family)